MDDGPKPVTLAVPQTRLDKHFTCPICWDLIKDAVAVSACLHRFCSDCINQHLRSGKHVCPSCRVGIPSRRSLHADENFDKLVSLLFPDVEDYEEREQQKIENIVNSESVTKLARKVEAKWKDTHKRKIRKQVHHRIPGPKTSHPKTTPGSHLKTNPDSNLKMNIDPAIVDLTGNSDAEWLARERALGNAAHSPQTNFAATEEKLCNIVLVVHPHEDDVKLMSGNVKPYLTVLDSCTVGDIKCYLAAQLNLPEDHLAIDMYDAKKNELAAMLDDQPIWELVEKHHIEYRDTDGTAVILFYSRGGFNN